MARALTSVEELQFEQMVAIFRALDSLESGPDCVTISKSLDGRVIVRLNSDDASESVSGVNSRDALSQISQVLACRV